MLSLPSSQSPKQVRFSERLDVCHLPKDERRRERWYNKKEYREFLMELYATRKKIQKQRELVTGLDEAFQTCLSLAGKLLNDFEEELALQHVPYHQTLMQWVIDEEYDCRGVERSSPLIKFHSGMTKDLKPNLLTTIKEKQKGDEEIRRLFAHNSRSAKIFARLIAECDARVVSGNTAMPHHDNNDNNEKEEEVYVSFATQEEQPKPNKGNLSYAPLIEGRPKSNKPNWFCIPSKFNKRQIANRPAAA